MRTQSEDTSPEVERIQIELIRQAPFAKILGLTCSMSSTVIQASRNTIRHLHPEMSEEELAVLYTELYYGKELAERLRLYLMDHKTNECAYLIAAVIPVVKAFYLQFCCSLRHGFLCSTTNDCVQLSQLTSHR